MMAAGMAFYFMLAIVPAMVGIITLYGLVATPSQVEATLNLFAQHLPAQASELLRGQLHDIVGAPSSSLGLALAVSILTTLWTASSGAAGMIEAVNNAFGERERRGFLRVRALALAFTLGGVALVAVTVGLLAILPSALSMVGLGALGKLVPYVVLALVVTLAIGLVYRYAPCSRREHPRRLVTWGSAVATTLWVVGTVAFDVYASRLGSYQETYGAFGGVVLLLIWLFLSSFAILVGAEIDAELGDRPAPTTGVGEPIA